MAYQAYEASLEQETPTTLDSAGQDYSASFGHLEAYSKQTNELELTLEFSIPLSGKVA